MSLHKLHQYICCEATSRYFEEVTIREDAYDRLAEIGTLLDCGDPVSAFKLLRVQHGADFDTWAASVLSTSGWESLDYFVLWLEAWEEYERESSHVAA